MRQRLGSFCYSRKSSRLISVSSGYQFSFALDLFLNRAIDGRGQSRKAELYAAQSERGLPAGGRYGAKARPASGTFSLSRTIPHRRSLLQ